MGGRCDGFKGWLWRDGWVGWLWRDGWVCGMGGLQKLITDLDMKNGYKGSVQVGFINIKDMYNNDVSKGVAYAYEAYEVK